MTPAGIFRAVRGQLWPHDLEVFDVTTTLLPELPFEDGDPQRFTRFLSLYLARARTEVPSDATIGPQPSEAAAGFASPAEEAGPPLQTAAPSIPEQGSPGDGGCHGLVVNETTFTVTRGGRSVSLARSRLTWNLLRALIRRCEGFWPVEELRANWEQFGGRSEAPEFGTVHDAVSRLRKSIRRLGLTVEHLAPGYRLAVLDGP
jgi:hypothetical protein